MDDECRFCLDVAEPGDPLLSPCKCSGTIAFAHLSCLNAGYRNANTFPICCETCRGELLVNPLEHVTKIKWKHYWMFFCEVIVPIMDKVVLPGAADILASLFRLNILFGYLCICGFLTNFAFPLLKATYVPELTRIDMANVVDIVLDLIMSFLCMSAGDEYYGPVASVKWSYSDCFMPGLALLVLTLVGRWLWKVRNIEDENDEECYTDAQLFGPLPHTADPSLDCFFPIPSDEELSDDDADFYLILVLCQLVLFIPMNAGIAVLWAVHWLWQPLWQKVGWENKAVSLGVDVLTLVCIAHYVLGGLAKYHKWRDGEEDEEYQYAVLVYEVEPRPSEKILFLSHTIKYLGAMYATLAVPYLHGMIVYYVLTGDVVYFGYRTPQGWELWLGGFVCWWEARTSKAQVHAMARRFSGGPHLVYERFDGPVLLPFLKYFVGVTRSLGQTAGLVWVYSRLFLKFCRPLAFPSLQTGHYWWILIILVALVTPLGDGQPPLSFVAFIWLRSAMWLRMTAILARGGQYGAAWALRECVFTTRLVVLPVVLGLVPLVAGRAVFANDLVAWLAGLALELPLIGYLLLKYEPVELKHLSKFKKWREAWDTRPNWRCFILALILGALLRHSWLKVLGWSTATLFWPEISYTVMLCLFVVDQRKSVSGWGLAAMFVVSGEWRLFRDSLHRCMRTCYPKVPFKPDRVSYLGPETIDSNYTYPYLGT